MNRLTRFRNRLLIAVYLIAILVVILDLNYWRP